MVCASIQNRNLEQIQEILSSGVAMAEIRLDSCPLSDDDIGELFSADIPLVATCRLQGSDPGSMGVETSVCEHRLTLAIQAGARYADLEIEAPKPLSKRIAHQCAEWGTVLIRSYHDFQGTASLDDLRQMVDKCRHHDGEIVKIVSTASSREDALRVLDLYKYYTADSLVAFAMGAEGAFSRIECLRCGSPLSYACVSAAEATAPGQMSYEDMYKAVYGERKRVEALQIRMPASKSYAQRAIIAAALADGKSILAGYSSCGDSDAALSVAKALGAEIAEISCPDGSTTLEIQGINAGAGCLDSGKLDVGESGLLTRLMMPIASVVYAGGAEITGHGTLLGRGLGLPTTVQGPLQTGKVTLDGSKSSQNVSGEIMARALLDKHSSISVQNPTSIPYIYMTMDILRKFGIKVRSEMYGGRALLDEDWSKCTEILLKVKEQQRYKAASFDIEGDWSAATVLLAAGAVFGQVSLTGLDTTSLQADLSMMDILMDAGASLSQLDEPKGVVTVTKAPLRAVRADLSNCPDLFPVTAVLCAFCQGQSVLEGVRRLSHKESDRAKAIVEMLLKAGVRVQIKGDQMLIWGESLESRILSSHLLKGGDYTSSGDHRMVMALRLAELGADAPIHIDDTACVAKSYPQFNTVWDEYIRK